MRAARGTAIPVAPSPAAVRDPAAGMRSGAPIAPDITVSIAEVVGPDLRLRVRFVPGTFSQQATLVQWSLDTDENPTTGNPGSDSGCVVDAATMGTEHVVSMGSELAVPAASVLNATGACNSFVGGGLGGTIVFTPLGMDVAIPLALLGGDDGRMNYKLNVFTQLGFAPDPISTTGLQDKASDAFEVPV